MWKLRSVHSRTPIVLGGVVAFGFLAILGGVLACDTPVYRYAMYRWEPAPYEVYYFHEGPIGEQAAKVHEALQAASQAEQQPANVFFRAVDLADESALKTLPPDVRHRWQTLEAPATPSYLIVAPHGVPIHRGDLQEAELETLLDSPARQEIFRQLSAGNATVLALVTGSDEAGNAEAEKLLQEFASDVASGKIEFYVPPSGNLFTPPGAEPAPAPPAAQLEVGYVKIDRQNPQEKWLVEALLSLEHDLKEAEFADKPMMFAIFGRGRALPPCIGRGISRENLLDCVHFVTGACSCTVKDENPGLDLLISADWQQAAQTLAAKFGTEEGNEIQLATEDFFPDLIIPAQAADTEMAAGDQSAPAEAAASTTVAEAGAGAEPVAETQPAEGSSAPSGGQAPPAAATSAEPAAAEPAGDVHAAAVAHAPASTTGGVHLASSPTAEAPAVRSVLIVGAGVGLAFLLLFGITFLVLRPR